MKQFTLMALLALVAGSPDWLQAQTTPWTTETADELVSPGDFDGDGLLDVLIVDKPLGVVRLGWGRADGGLDWSDVRSLALENVGSLAVGRIQNTARDSFVVTGPDWNATYLYPGTRDAASIPQVMTPPVFAPSALAAVDVGGPRNNPNLADLFVAGGDFDPATGEVRSASVLPGALILVGQSVLDAPQHRGHAAKLTARARAATFASVSPTESVLTFWSQLDTAPAPGLPVVTELPPNSDFVQTPFGLGQTTLLIFTPGQPVLIRQPLITATTLGPPSRYDLGQPIDFVVALQTATLQIRLLVSFNHGTSAAAYSLDDADAPVLKQTFTPADGTRFTGAASASDGGALHWLTGPTAGGGTTGWQRWNFTDTTFTAGPAGTVPAVSPLAARRDVFFFSQEIFVEPTATLLASAKAADWSTSVSAGSPVEVTAAQFLSSARGLGSEASYGLGARPIVGSFGVPNQYAPDISLSRLGGGGPLPPLGHVTFEPPSGRYAEGTSIHLVPPGPDYAIFYRQERTGPWLAYTGPLTLPAGGISLEALARPPGAEQSTPAAHAVYVAAVPPPLTAPSGSDTNGNGLTDSWEDAFGVNDPSADPDHDNATNRQEHDAGTDPNNPADAPIPTSLAIFDNINGTFNGTSFVTTTTWLANKFCLGSQPYQLDSLASPLTVAGFDVRKCSVRLQIYSHDAASGKPSASTGVIMNLSGLTNPISLRPDNETMVTWTPAAPFTLMANRCYWAVLSIEKGISVWQAGSATRPTGDAGTFGRVGTTDAGVTWGMPDPLHNGKMLIRGTAAVPPEEFEITAVSQSETELEITFPTLSGRSYLIESRAALNAGEWTEIPGSNRIGTGTPLQVTISDAFPEPQQFYRVKQWP